MIHLLLVIAAVLILTVAAVPRHWLRRGALRRLGC
jgi:hypothetical protein